MAPKTLLAYFPNSASLELTLTKSYVPRVPGEAKYACGNKFKTVPANATLFCVGPTICLSGLIKSSQARDSVKNSGLNKMGDLYFFCSLARVPGAIVDLIIKTRDGE